MTTMIRQPVNILLVDDQPAKLLSYEVILGELGENLIKANSASEALGALLKTDVAVVLVDVCMPDLDGFQLAEMIRIEIRLESSPDQRAELLGRLGDLAERRLAGDVPDSLILLEHPPVFTAGRRSKPEHLLWSEPEAAARGAAVHHIDRGGSFTFHGPGQLVGYPILHLGVRPDAVAYLRALEDAVIRTGAALGVELHRRDDVQTGVFAGDDKVCAIGVRLMRTRVTLHGFAINCDTDLSWFQGIVACGLSNNGVTSLSALLDRDVTVDEVRPIARRALAEVFDLDYRQAPAEELERFRSALVARARRGSATLGDQRVPEPVLEPAERPRLVRARRPLDVAQPMDADPRPAPSFGGTDVRER